MAMKAKKSAPFAKTADKKADAKKGKMVKGCKK